MIPNQDLRWSLPTTYAARSTGVLSGFVDCTPSGINYDRIRLVAQKSAFSGKNSKLVLRARHATASGVTFASATAFSSNAIVSGTTTSGAQAISLNISREGGTGRFVRYTLSTITASANAGVIAMLTEGDTIPQSNDSFAAVVQVPSL